MDEERTEFVGGHGTTVYTRDSDSTIIMRSERLRDLMHQIAKRCTDLNTPVKTRQTYCDLAWTFLELFK